MKIVLDTIFSECYSSIARAEGRGLVGWVNLANVPNWPPVFFALDEKRLTHPLTHDTIDVEVNHDARQTQNAPVGIAGDRPARPALVSQSVLHHTYSCTLTKITHPLIFTPRKPSGREPLKEG